MDTQLANKAAFVSGSTLGIGYAIAKGLLAEGASVVINGRDEARVETAVKTLRREIPGSKVSGLAADFGDTEQVRHLLDSLGDVDILVNNVGLFEVAPFDTVTDDDWQRYFNVNVMSGVRLSRHLLSGMLRRGWGRIIFINSESGVNVPANMLHYGTTKAALLALGNGLAKLTGGTGVTVNSILGGPTFSDGVADAVRQIAEAQAMDSDALKATIIGGNATSLLQRFIEPAEIASLARSIWRAQSHRPRTGPPSVLTAGCSQGRCNPRNTKLLNAGCDGPEQMLPLDCLDPCIDRRRRRPISRSPCETGWAVGAEGRRWQADPNTRGWLPRRNPTR